MRNIFNKINKTQRITDPNFFSTDAVILAQKLLGKIIVREINKKIIKARIIETEAYNGKIDRACHAHPENKSQWKASSLYKPGGFTYVYLIYGIYYCFNIVSSNKGDPQGVLIRAVEILQNSSHRLWNTNGPGKLCRTLNIDMNLNGINLIDSNLVYIEDDGLEIAQKDIVITKRINIDYAGEDKNRMWRFYIKDNIFVLRK